jgi:hypothetical protein
MAGVRNRAPEVIVIESCGPTGVISPDRVHELRTQRGYHCLACGHIEET